MTTPTPSETPSNGSTPFKLTAMRSAMLGVAAQAELKSAVANCIFGAVSRGYSMEELAESHLYGPKHFKALADGADTTFFTAIELARACGYRLRIGVELLTDELPVDPGSLATPFEVASKFLKGHEATKHIEEDAREELLRGIMAHYFSQMKEKGYYMSKVESL